MSFEQHRNPDGTYNGIAVMAEVTGGTTKTMMSLYDEVRANSEQLRACGYHEFSPILPRVPIRQRYRCIHCGGEVDAGAYYWHEQGRRKAV